MQGIHGVLRDLAISINGQSPARLGFHFKLLNINATGEQHPRRESDSNVRLRDEIFVSARGPDVPHSIHTWMGLSGH